MTNQHVFISVYHGSTVYEPEEGYYYVPKLHLVYTSKPMKWKHAHREFKKLIAEHITGEWACGTLEAVTNYWACICTGIHVGDKIVIHIESVPGMHKGIYHGHC